MTTLYNSQTTIFNITITPLSTLITDRHGHSVGQLALQE
jgi:hypothetical protein